MSEVNTAPQPARAEQVCVPRVSRLATVSFVLNLLGLVSCGLTGLIGLPLGVLALLQIWLSKGWLRGAGQAAIGVCVSMFMLCLFWPMDFSPLSPNKKAQCAQCQANMKQLLLAFRTYCEDNDSRWPLKQNWCEALVPHAQNERLFQCPSLRRGRCGYAYNPHLSTLSLEGKGPLVKTVVLFDAKAGWNLAGGSQLADLRHSDGLNVASADGHVKWLRSLDSVRWRPARADHRGGAE